jgi:UDP-N-acetylmuramoylalanine--D-glutamate ligase
LEKISLLRGKPVLVAGLGKSGFSAAKLLSKVGAEVIVVDQKDNLELRNRAKLLKNQGIKVNLDYRFETNVLDGKSLMLVSPGIPPDSLLMRKAREIDLPIYSEVELAYWFSKVPIIGITGTDGKTTTTTLVGNILSKAGLKVVLAGNIGNPLSQAVLDANQSGVDYLVTELSSFQLKYTKFFRPVVSCLLNIATDHLDWHEDVQDYFQSKKKIIANQSNGDWLVLNADDDKIANLSSQAKTVYFSQRKVVHGVYLSDGKIISNLNLDNGTSLPLLDCGSLSQAANWNLENIIAAIAICLPLGASRQDIVDSVAGFTGLEHRLEFVGKWDGVSYVNDSKATNPHSAIRALMSFNEPVVWLAGGQSKGSSFTELAKVARDKVKTAILFGESAGKLKETLEKVNLTAVVANRFDQAVNLARKTASSGDVVLLSPACASFDMFKDYAERGSCFKELVLSAKQR